MFYSEPYRKMAIIAVCEDSSDIPKWIPFLRCVLVFSSSETCCLGRMIWENVMRSNLLVFFCLFFGRWLKITNLLNEPHYQKSHYIEIRTSQTKPITLTIVLKNYVIFRTPNVSLRFYFCGFWFSSLLFFSLHFATYRRFLSVHVDNAAGIGVTSDSMVFANPTRHLSLCLSFTK